MPVDRTYTNVLANQTGKDYTATPNEHYIIHFRKTNLLTGSGKFVS